MISSVPLVSVVIPTFHRPDLLLRAIQSVQAQTFRALEIVIVIDGVDVETSKALECIVDPRLKVICLPGKVGRGAATNAGVQAANTEWIALLDDDDEWLPDKIMIQWQTAQSSQSQCPIISCRFKARAEAGELTWPRRSPSPNEPLCEYLLVQRGLRGGEGMLLPSTLLLRRKLMLAVPWGMTPVFNDLDWLLRTAAQTGITVEFVPYQLPLVIWHMDGNRNRISLGGDWKSALQFGRDHRDLLTSKAHISFLLTQVSMIASRSGNPKLFFALVRESFLYGRPRLLDLAAHLLIWLVSPNSRIRITAELDRWKEKLGKKLFSCPADPRQR